MCQHGDIIRNQHFQTFRPSLSFFVKNMCIFRTWSISLVKQEGIVPARSFRNFSISKTCDRDFFSQKISKSLTEKVESQIRVTDFDKNENIWSLACETNN